jgi:glutaredoxin
MAGDSNMFGHKEKLWDRPRSTGDPEVKAGRGAEINVGIGTLGQTTTVLRRDQRRERAQAEGDKMRAIVYSLPEAVDCQAAIRFFSENGIQFEDRSVEQPEFERELVTEYGSLTVPTIVVGDEVILGFSINKNRIAKALNLERR